MMNKTYIGIDLGGTSLKLGESDGAGKILRQTSVPSGYLTQREALDLTERALGAFLAQSVGKPAAVGMGLLGRIDSGRGLWLELDHDRREELPVAEILSKQAGLPCYIDNDVRSAAKAELLFGSAGGLKNWAYVNVGTGVAAAVFSGGRPVQGGHFNAGEVGHTASGVGFHAPCSCGRPDCVEPVASGMGLDLCARLLAPEFPDTKLKIPESGRVRAEDIFALYGEDPLCRTLTDNAAKALANLLMNLVRFCDPEKIVLCGGVMTGGFLLDKIKAYLNRFTMRYVTGGIVLSPIPPQDIGVLGACANAIMYNKEETYA